MLNGEILNGAAASLACAVKSVFHDYNAFLKHFNYHLLYVHAAARTILTLYSVK